MVVHQHSKDIEFEIKIQDEIPSYSIESHELVEVLGNLLDNTIEAAEHSGEKGCSSRIVLILGMEEKRQLIEIKNTAKPMDIKNAENIFQKGFSTKEGKRRGYGLYNVNKVIDRYNGTIELS